MTATPEAPEAPTLPYNTRPGLSWMVCHQSPCGLPYHQPGQRVQWQTWRDNGWRWNRGTVLAHTNRTLVVLVGDERVVTSCGPVVAEVGK